MKTATSPAQRGGRKRPRPTGVPSRSLVMGILCLLVASGCAQSNPAEPVADSTPSPPELTTEATAEATTPSSFAFTDDTGATIELPSSPNTIVAQEDSAAALWHLGIEVDAVFGTAPLDDNPQLRGVDVSGMESVGQAFHEIDVEAVAATEPDLIVTTLYPPDEVGWGIADEQQEAQLEGFAPVVKLDASGSATQSIERFEELAAALGADLDAPELVEAREDFEAAAADLQAQVADGPEVRVLAMAGGEGEAYVAKPEFFPDLQNYVEWGIDVITPDGEDPYYQTLSWELIDTYPADLVYYDARAHWLGLDALRDKPTFAQLPAVQEGHTAPWLVGTATSYQQFTDSIRGLTEAIQQVQAEMSGSA